MCVNAELGVNILLCGSAGVCRWCSFSVACTEKAREIDAERSALRRVIDEELAVVSTSRCIDRRETGRVLDIIFHCVSLSLICICPACIP